MRLESFSLTFVVLWKDSGDFLYPKQFGVTHNQVNASKGGGFNIKIERLHNSVRHRIKTFRGFHGSIESANAIMRGYEIYYNRINGWS